MKPRDYALEIEPGASPARLHEIESVIRRAIADDLCIAAIKIDEEDRRSRIRFPTEAAQICRQQAEEHLQYT